MVVSAQAAFQTVETFDSLTLDNISGQNGWSASTGNGEVVLDPAGGSNQVLKVLTGVLYKAANVAEGTTRMLFLRLRFEEHDRYSFGLSNLLNPDQYGDFKPELGMAAATASDPGNDFRVANGLSSTGVYDVLTTLMPDTWYNIWVLVNNSSDIYEVWLNSNPGSEAQADDQLSNDAAEILFGFRTTSGADEDLINFYIKAGGGSSMIDGRFYLDDIYLENTDDVNLSNPLGGVDSNDDGISDADAVALGLDPNDPDGDTDGDGDSDVLEVGGDVNSPRDSDGDGVIDALEPGLSATDASVASGLTLSSGDTMSITTAAGEMLSAVSAAAATGGPAGINFPFGSISYTTSSPVGGSVTVRMAFSADLPVPLGLYKEDDGVFSELPADIWTLVDPATVDITLTDGDLVTDLDGVAGSIEDPVAPAEVVPLTSTSTSSSGGGGGCALNTAGQQDPDPIFPLLMLAVSGYWFRRRWC
jgi:hypothetical protein